MANLAEIYNWFMTGKKPTQAQFWASWGSSWNKEEQIPQSAISNLTAVLNAKTENNQFNAHKVASDAHADLFDEKEDKTQKGISGGYAPLDEFSKISHQFLSIVNNLIDGSASDLLSGEQGVVLQTQINAINTLLTSNDVNLDTVQEIVNAIKIVETSLSTILINDLTTGGTTKALTAEMGKRLEDVKLTALIATDIDTQLTNAIAEDNKVISRSKLFNWWEWAKTKSITLTNTLIMKSSAIALTSSTGGYPYVQMFYDGIVSYSSASNYFQLGYQKLAWYANGFKTDLFAATPSKNNALYVPNKSGTLAVTNDFVTTAAGTTTQAPLIIPNGVLTTVPQNGAIERDSNGFLFETHNGVRSRISTQTVSSDWTNITLLNDATAMRARYRTNGDMVELDIYVFRTNINGTSAFATLPSDIAPTKDMWLMGCNISTSSPIVISIINGNIATVPNTGTQGLVFTAQYKRF